MDAKAMAHIIFQTIPEQSVRDILDYIKGPYDQEHDKEKQDKIINDLQKWIEKEGLV